MFNLPLNHLLVDKIPESDEGQGEPFINFPANNLCLIGSTGVIGLQAVLKFFFFSPYPVSRQGVLPSVKNLR